jgi:ribose-phosphate pyrophosphokinase
MTVGKRHSPSRDGNSPLLNVKTGGDYAWLKRYNEGRTTTNMRHAPSSRNPLKVYCGTANAPLAEAVAAHLGMPLGEVTVKRFPDDEMYVKFDESVRGAETFLIQPTCPPIETHLLELLMMIDALRRASAESISCVLPYYGYARQERKAQPREPITAKLIANLLTTAGADRIVTMDLHADAIQGFFDIPVDHLTAIGLIGEYLVGKGWGHRKDVVVVSPDEGAWQVGDYRPGGRRARQDLHRLR